MADRRKKNKTGELTFDDDGVRRVAKWAHLKLLICFESERLQIYMEFKIERQVSTRLRVFSKKNI